MRLAISFLIGVVIGAAAVLVILNETGRLQNAPDESVVEPAVAEQPISEQPKAARPVGAPAPPPRTEVVEVEVEPTVVPSVSPQSTPAQDAIAIPVAGVRREQLRDHFDDPRGGRAHRAIDIEAPRGTPVLAAIDGSVRKLFLSRAGGITIYQADPAGQWIYYYAHLDAYAPALAEGKPLKRGDVIGFVGTTGNAPPGSPHLHFAIERMSPSGEWWKGEPVNPYPILMSRGVTFQAGR